VQTTGLSVDNTEAAGALSSEGLTETDILAGRYDTAELRIWEVDWSDVANRKLLFQGTLGEITRCGGAFRAELRGLSEPLSRSGGRVFSASCPAVLGDQSCQFDLAATGFFTTLPIVKVSDAGAVLQIPPGDFPDGWFSHGRVRFLEGSAKGLHAIVRRDRLSEAGRLIELWSAPGATPEMGDAIRIEAGCDKRFATCRKKFGNQLNFRGFPHIPSEDWLTSMPRVGGNNDGGRRA
jgi:uncharacterized phage protein (TIGR02218 family)